MASPQMQLKGGAEVLNGNSEVAAVDLPSNPGPTAANDWLNIMRQEVYRTSWAWKHPYKGRQRADI